MDNRLTFFLGCLFGVTFMFAIGEYLPDREVPAAIMITTKSGHEIGYARTDEQQILNYNGGLFLSYPIYGDSESFRQILKGAS